MTRDGGFFIVLIIRLSAVPAHFSTAVFSTCDVKFWHFAVATLLSMPKQIFLVYLGVLLVQQEAENDLSKTISFGVVFLITIGLGVWIFLKMKKIKTVLLEEQELRRVKRMEEVEEQAMGVVVPTAKSGFDRRYDDEAVGWTVQPTQPASIL